MLDILTKIITLDSVQCCVITSILYMIPLEKKENWKRRFAVVSALCLGIGPLLQMLQKYILKIFRGG